MSRPKSKVAGHLPVEDPDVPRDHLGRPFCRCGVAIVPGDPRHTLPAAPGQAAHVARYEHVDEGGE